MILQKKFNDAPNWYCSNDTIDTSRHYLSLLQLVLSIDPTLSPQLKHCCRCGIDFFTAKCNVNRNDLRCPFGCREAHRKESSNKRSIEYYQTSEGKKKKKEQNNKRNQKSQDDKDREKSSSDNKPNNKKFWQYIQFLIGFTNKIKVENNIFITILNTLAEDLRQHPLLNLEKDEKIIGAG